jgi:glucan 1,4-alpha-glucosidase
LKFLVNPLVPVSLTKEVANMARTTTPVRAGLGTAIALAGIAVITPAAAAPATTAPGAPGVESRFDLARKDCVGTAANTSSKVWYTVAGGILSDVYGPTVDNTNVQTMQFLVTDGSTFTDLQSRDATYTVRSLDRSGMACEVTSTAKNGKYRLVTDYLTDPQRDSVVIRVRLQPATGAGNLALYVRLDASVNGNGGGGGTNGGADTATVDPASTALVSVDTNTVSNAVNRTYASPTALALRADRPFQAESSGYAGTDSDGLTQLDTTHALAASYGQAPSGNVVQTAKVSTDHGVATLALGLGHDATSAIATAGASARTPFDATLAGFARSWQRYDAGLRQPPQHFAGLSPAQADKLSAAYWLSVNVLKASEDKTYPGAVVAALASPWGQAVSAGGTPDGKAVYFGSYREVFSRDLYEAFTGLLTDGDLATARDTVRFLFLRQQRPDGRFPRNSLVNGLSAPDTGGDQLDESAYPILMAWQAGLSGDATLWPHIQAAADFVVAHGPAYGNERWEEQSGYSPSTIAAEIAGLVAAGAIAEQHGDAAHARLYRATADSWQRQLRSWLVTTTGPLGSGRYFIRLSKTGDPNTAVSYGLGNGSITADQRSIVDGGFLELSRLGVLSADDPDIKATLPVVDQVIGRRTPSGQGYYRYGTDTAGTEDGYGDCYQPDPTSCTPTGAPWAATDTGSGHLWPVLSGERAEQRLQTGDRSGAAALLLAMNSYASGVGLVPEQDWEDPDVAASAPGSDPATASIGFTDGGPAGSAAPLTWAQAEEVRLTLSMGSSTPVEQPSIVRDRYVSHPAPAGIPVTVTGPADGTVTDSATTTVTGTTSPGTTLTVAAAPTDLAGPTTTVSTTADRSGRFSATVSLGYGANVITVAGALGSATGYARLTVVSDVVPGTTVLDVTDPSGDDHGPGTFAYPTAADFHDGAFDIQRFQVIDAGTTVYLRTQLRDLTPTFGSAMGAQLLDVYVRDPAAGTTSTAAPYASRDYTVGDGFTQRMEVQGFASPVYVDASGASKGSVTVTATQATRSILVAVPKSVFGQPGAGWVFTVALHGQDGFSSDQARGFAATAGAYQFGVCGAGGTAAICGADPATVPRVMDTLTPVGVSQSTELDPTLGPVTLRGVTVSGS